MSVDDALVSNQFFARVWEFWARRSRAGEVSHLPGLIAPWMNVTWPVCNLTLLSEPVANAADLEARAEAALSFAQERPRGWVFFVCRELLPEALRETYQDLLAPQGLVPVVPITGMAADRLLPTRRPMPELAFRPVADAETRRAFGEINARAYEMPVELGYEALDVEALWGEEAFGVVGYDRGVPVTTAEAIALDGALYVALVATLPEHQGKGYGEAAMRDALTRAQQATGLEATVLHATPAGLPLYQEMGYRPRANFLGFITPEAESH